MLRLLATALSVIILTTATLCFSAPTPPVVTPEIALVSQHKSTSLQSSPLC